MYVLVNTGGVHERNVFGLAGPLLCPLEEEEKVSLSA